MRTQYLIALGSNRPHGRFGGPKRVVEAALRELGGDLRNASPIITSAPIGPSRRAYANAVALIESDLTPLLLLAKFKQLEAAFGRRNSRRWGSRVLDLDIILWSGGIWVSNDLTIPHLALRTRAFVLKPAVSIAPCWRDPINGYTLRQLKARLDRARPRP